MHNNRKKKLIKKINKNIHILTTNTPNGNLGDEDENIIT